MPVAWWIGVDRDQLLTETRGLVPDGGCLVIQGDDSSGRAQALQLAENFLLGLGLETLLVSSKGQPATLRNQILEIWARVIDPPATGIAPWVTAANLPLATLCGRIAAVLSDAGLTAILIEDVDRDEPLPEHIARLWVSVAADAGAVLVFTSLPHTDWSQVNVVRHTDLPPFSEAEIRHCLNTSPELAALSTETLEEAVALVKEPDGSITTPNQVYTRLAAWGLTA